MVGCKSLPALEQYPPSLSEFHTGLDLTRRVVRFNERILNFTYVKEKEYAVNKLFRVKMSLATVAILDEDNVFICC